MLMLMIVTKIEIQIAILFFPTTQKLCNHRQLINNNNNSIKQEVIILKLLITILLLKSFN